jgi:hypothetical protein
VGFSTVFVGARAELVELGELLAALVQALLLIPVEDALVVALAEP